MKRIISVLGILMLSAGLAACNTVRGFGTDVERGGEKLQGAAKDVQSGSSTGGSANRSTTGTSSTGSTAR